MRRSRRSDKRRDAGGQPPEGWPPPDPVVPEVEVLGTEVGPTAYRVTPVRPLSQRAARIGLWSAVGIGVVGGVLGLLRPPVQQVQPVVEQSADDDSTVPAPVAGMAELVVQEWLTVDVGNEGRDDVLDALFVEPIDGAGSSLGDLLVERVTTVGGQARHDGYWAVTVAADVVETVPGPGDDDEVEVRPSTWFVEVAIVGDAEGALAALTAPAVVPAPPDVTTGWKPSTEAPRAADDGPLATTVQGFLDALLAGDGDPSRYMAPGGELAAVTPTPFELVELVELSADELPDGTTRVLAEVVATTPGGTTTGLTYEVLLVEREDRWEVTQFAGAPTLLVGEEPADDTDGTGGPGGTDGTGGTGGAEAEAPGEEPSEGERPAVRQTSTTAQR